jgi:hypothetical protein
MTLSEKKQSYIYFRLREIRNLRDDIIILKKISLIGKLEVPHINSKIDHLHNVSKFSYGMFKKEIKELELLNKELTEIKEKLMSYYD